MFTHDFVHLNEIPWNAYSLLQSQKSDLNENGIFWCAWYISGTKYAPRNNVYTVQGFLVFRLSMLISNNTVKKAVILTVHNMRCNRKIFMIFRDLNQQQNIFFSKECMNINKIFCVYLQLQYFLNKLKIKVFSTFLQLFI